jgi:hypothetical protein
MIMNIKQLLFTLACITCVSQQGFSQNEEGPGDDVYEMKEKLDLGNDEHHTSNGTPTVPTNNESESVIEDVEEEARKAKNYVKDKAEDAEDYVGDKVREAEDYLERDSDEEDK